MAQGVSTPPGEHGRGRADEGGLTSQALAALLERLGPDRDRAAEAYEQIRRRLVQLFEWRAWDEPEALADETIDRVARRLAEGLEIRAEDPYAYFAGVASMILREMVRRAERERAAVRVFPPSALPAEEDARLACLEGCLGGLSERNRELVLSYYAAEGTAHVRSRAHLAEVHGLEAGTLRVRVHRLRGGLEDCVRRCLDSAGERNVSAPADTEG